jgi:hypothetical protein
VIFTIASGLIAVAAIAAVIYLLWPTWKADHSPDTPSSLPVSVGDTLFNVPVNAFREKVQRYSGPQERIDLSFDFPSLTPPGPPRHVTAATVEAGESQTDRIFLSIAAHHDAMSPDERLQTIFPRYLDETPAPARDGLMIQPFRDGTPYEHEDLAIADALPHLVARCTRDSGTPGMCLSERRVDGADLTFRFPRRWLAQWRDVATAMDRLTTQLHGSPR